MGAKKTKFKFGYMFGNKGRRKNRSAWFDNEMTRNMYAAADKSNGFRVRKYKKKVV